MLRFGSSDRWDFSTLDQAQSPFFLTLTLLTFYVSDISLPSLTSHLVFSFLLLLLLRSAVPIKRVAFAAADHGNSCDVRSSMQRTHKDSDSATGISKRRKKGKEEIKIKHDECRLLWCVCLFLISFLFSLVFPLTRSLDTFVCTDAYQYTITATLLSQFNASRCYSWKKSFLCRVHSYEYNARDYPSSVWGICVIRGITAPLSLQATKPTSDLFAKTSGWADNSG